MKDHLLLTVLYALGVSVFFGTLWKDSLRDRARHGAVIFGSLVGGAILVAWLMALIAHRG